MTGAGDPPAQFFTTVWATNLTSSNETFTFEFLKQGQANTSPAKFSDTLSPGQTKVYENIVEDKLGLSSAIGAARVVSSGEILLSERIYNQPAGEDVGNTEGLFFAGVPKSFSISLGRSATVQGVDQGGSEDFRYNFALVETGGGTPTVHVALIDGDGTALGSRDYVLQPFEQIQPNVTDLSSAVSTTNARITATVAAGTGSVLLAGAQVANESQDPSGFEMSFRDDLLGSGGGAGVTSLNGLIGALAITAGDGITVTPSGGSIQVAFTGGGSTGITSVTHDASLSGAGTGASPLAISGGQVVRSLNGLHDAVTLAAGSNVTITPSGNILTIASSGGGGGGGLSVVSHDATLAGSGTGGSPLGIALPLSLTGNVADYLVNVTNQSTDSLGAGGQFFGNEGLGVFGFSNHDVGVEGGSGTSVGISGATAVGPFGVEGSNGSSANDTGGVDGVDGTFNGGLTGQLSAGVRGRSGTHLGVLGFSRGPAGVQGRNGATATDSAGVSGLDGTGTAGITGISSAGVRGESATHFGVAGLSGGPAGVLGLNKTTTNGSAGVFGVDGSGQTGISNVLSAGVRGDSTTKIGVLGVTEKGFAVIGTLGNTGVQGELGSIRNSKDWALFATGNVNVVGTFTASGTKSFVEPHPTDPTREIRFVCLEGPESGTYFRGTGHIVGGFAKIEVPESFRSVSDEKGLTVVATAVGGPGSLWIVKKGLDEIVLQANSDVEFDYVVNGVRRAYKDFEAVRSNESFVPDGPDDRKFSFYAPEIQRRLVATGIYNADGTVNRETAHRLGWDRNWRRAPADDAAANLSEPSVSR